MLPEAGRYRDFTDGVFDGLAERSPEWGAVFSELDLQSLWYAGEFGCQLVTTEGRQLSVRDFGVWNHGAGPDFTGCALNCGGEVLCGDIELDPDARDWERHGHGANSQYESVVLHLFTQMPEAKFYTRTSAHREVMQVLLKPEMLRHAARPRRVAEARLGRCSNPLREMESTRVNSLLESAAQYRLQRKSERLRQVADIHGREQAVYQALAAALGYRRNQKPFTILAQRLPLKTMLKLDAADRESLLFGVFGFLESVRYEDTEPETRVYLRELWSRWWKQRSAHSAWLEEPRRLQWEAGGARPGNHPQRRLGALCAMLTAWKRIYGPVKSASAWSPVDFSAALLGLQHDYWSRHYTLLAEPSVRPLALIGRTRLQEILANVAYPLLFSERAELWAEFTRLPAVLDNQKVRRAALRLFGDEARQFQKRLYQQQGLLQIYEDYCLEDDSGCGDCPFPEKLKQWRGS